MYKVMKKQWINAVSLSLNLLKVKSKDKGVTSIVFITRTSIFHVNLKLSFLTLNMHLLPGML